MDVDKTSRPLDGNHYGLTSSSLLPEKLAVRHPGRVSSVEFIDTTVNVISAIRSHAGFGAAYFAEGCPHKKSEVPVRGRLF